MKPFVPLLALLPMLAAACAAAQPSATPTVSLTLSPSPSATARHSDTPQPATATATDVPIEGTLTIKVNVRSGPGTSSASLGLLEAGVKVQILFTDPSAGWFQILYPAAPDGTGWVAAQYVKIPTGVVVPRQATATPSGPSGRVLQRLNLRSGPGTSFDSLGTLEPEATVSLTGKDATAAWFQVKYPAGPNGRAWVTAQYIQTEDSDRLPVLDAYGTPVAAGTAGPLSPQQTPSPTSGPAFADGDSAAAPAVRVTFSGAGTRSFSYSSQVSAPEGDPEDWVEFTPYAFNAVEAQVVFSLTCSGNGRLVVTLAQAGVPLSGWGSLACGDANKTIALAAGKAYQLQLTTGPGSGLQWVDYVLRVQNLP